MGLSFFGHFLNFRLVQITAVLNSNRLLFARTFVLSGDVQNTVSVDVKGNFDLRHTPGRRRDTVQNKPAKRFVVGGHFALALQNMDFHAVLVVAGGRESFGLAGRGGGVALDQLGRDAAKSFDSERQWRDIQQQHVFDVTL